MNLTHEQIEAERAAFLIAFPNAHWREGETCPDQMWAIDKWQGWLAARSAQPAIWTQPMLDQVAVEAAALGEKMSTAKLPASDDHEAACNLRFPATLGTEDDYCDCAEIRAFRAKKAAASPSPVPASQPVEAVAWRCFHCNETFTHADQARLHFGPTEHSTPACQYDLAMLREIEETQRRHAEDDTDLDRQIYGMRSRHAVELRREEEKGYARGLKDAVTHPAKAEAPVEAVNSPCIEDQDGIPQAMKAVIQSSGSYDSLRALYRIINIWGAGQRSRAPKTEAPAGESIDTGKFRGLAYTFAYRFAKNEDHGNQALETLIAHITTWGEHQRTRGRQEGYDSRNAEVDALIVEKWDLQAQLATKPAAASAMPIEFELPQQAGGDAELLKLGAEYKMIKEARAKRGANQAVGIPCACEFSEDGETLLTCCAAHAAWKASPESAAKPDLSGLTALSVDEITHHFKDETLFYQAEQVDALLAAITKETGA